MLNSLKTRHFRAQIRPVPNPDKVVGHGIDSLALVARATDACWSLSGRVQRDMSSTRLCWLLIVGVSLFLSALVCAPQAGAQNNAPQATSPTQPPPVLHYTLPPDKLQQSYALYLIEGVLYFVTTVWGLLVLYGMLRTRFGARLRDLAMRVSRFRLVQAAIVTACRCSIGDRGSATGPRTWHSSCLREALLDGACTPRCDTVRDAGGSTSGWGRFRSLSL